MGWDFCDAWKTKKNVLDALPADMAPWIIDRILPTPAGAAIVAHRPETPEKRIAWVALIEKQGKSWGYKLMDEGMGPYDVRGFPKTWLADLAPLEEVGGSAASFRERVASS